MLKDMPKCFDEKKVHTPENIKILRALMRKHRTINELKKIGTLRDVKQLYDMGVIAKVSDDGEHWKYMNTLIARDLILSYKPKKSTSLDDWLS